MNDLACIQFLVSECARPRAQQPPQFFPNENHLASLLRWESLWPKTATLRRLKR